MLIHIDHWRHILKLLCLFFVIKYHLEELILGVNRYRALSLLHLLLKTLLFMERVLHCQWHIWLSFQDLLLSCQIC